MGNERTPNLMEKISVARAKHYFCPNCGKTYRKNEVWFNGWVSKWCPLCFKNQESLGDCRLEEKD